MYRLASHRVSRNACATAPAVIGHCVLHQHRGTSTSTGGDAYAQLMAKMQSVDTSAKKRNPTTSPKAGSRSSLNTAKPALASNPTLSPLSAPEIKQAPPETPLTTSNSSATSSSSMTNVTSAAPAKQEDKPKREEEKARPEVSRLQLFEDSNRAIDRSRFTRKPSGGSQPSVLENVSTDATTTTTPPSTSSTSSSFTNQQKNVPTVSTASSTVTNETGTSTMSTTSSTATTTSVFAGKDVVPHPAAVLPLTSTEMIQEGAPQHFIREPDTPVIHRPVLRSSGCVAMCDVVGRVHTTPSAFSDSAENGDFTTFTVQYDIPFSESPLTKTIEVRAYGPQLLQYTIQQVAVGDVVHVSGHLLPTEDGMAVVALPWGGNIQVVLRAQVSSSLPQQEHQQRGESSGIK